MRETKVEHDDGVIRIVTCQNLVVAAWFDAPTMEQMRALDRVMTSARRRHPKGLFFSNVVVEGTPRFSKEITDEAARQTRMGDGIDLGTVHLILAGGLVGAAVRAFMSTVTLMSRPKSPTKVMSDPAEASRFLAERSKVGGTPFSAADVEAVIEIAKTREARVGAT